MTMVVVVSAAFMLVGLIGVLVPVLPGLLLVWLGLLLWAVSESSPLGWMVLGTGTVLYAVGVVGEYLLPGRAMRRAGVATSTLVVGVLVAVLGAIVLPVVGALIGFPVGIYLVQRLRVGSHAAALSATRQAVRAIGLNILIQVITAGSMIGVWVLALRLG